MLKHIVHVSKGFAEAQAWEIEQELSMTPAERQEAARYLREKVWGKNRPDVRAAQKIAESRHGK
jgi:hypothetical protein